ncbi:MAG TPA: 3-deoxy-7-phosphoheptulonate synthase [Verrucomicrobiae bacterium]
MQPINNLHVQETKRLLSPNALKAQLPLSQKAEQTVVKGREAVRAILRGEDPRLLVILGPCSIHDPSAALDYAARLVKLQQELSDRLCIVMRVYFEKPRTTIGWKGLINDPHLNGTYDIEAGLKVGRKLLLQINELGLPAATEFLDPIVPQYLAELISWAAIGARTTESQTHREMASGLSMPVGFKNGTDGSLQTAIDAMTAARSAHSFLGIDPDGFTSIISTTGNPDGHVVLRGGRVRTNYDAESIAEAVTALNKAKLPPRLMVDCSHANSGKQHAKQEEVWNSVIAQRAEGNQYITGVMVESFLSEGSQALKAPADLKYGVSITDACIDWTTTERILRKGHEGLAKLTAQTAVA